MNRLFFAAVAVGALGSAVTAVVYVNFTARVMPSLARVSDPHGIAAMQGFNRTAVQPPFMSAFFGAAFAAVVIGVRLLRGSRDAADIVATIGAAAYLVGFVLTIAYNVPLNDRLAKLDPNAVSSVRFWRMYLSSWTTANTVRAVLSTIGAVTFAAAGVVGVLNKE